VVFIDACAGSERETLDLLEVSKPAAAILDIKLGDATSLSVAAACKERHVPVIFATELQPDELGTSCDNYPVLTKPFSLEALRLALSEALRQHPPARRSRPAHLFCNLAEKPT
jgi:DNA-binding response OmpR family regulator